MQIIKKIIAFLKLAWAWLVKSSANAQNQSLFIKGILKALIPTVIVVFKLFNVELGNEKLEGIVDLVILSIGVFYTFVSSIQILFGGIRKIWLSLKGENDVLVQAKMK